MSNRLANETSPYLLQHAENPVDWYPWGEAALSEAERRDKPILLSIGYSACHWCHVMERESFEDPDTAALMNEGFVNIKVDREERPDLDSIYMRAVQASTGRGGWPLTAFLTPDGRFFYGGTYFPPEPRYGMPSFRQVLAAVLDAFRNRRDEVEEGSNQILDLLRFQPGSPGDPGSKEGAGGGSSVTVRPDDPPGREELLSKRAEATLTRAAKTLADRYDPVHGGFGPAPKFPQPVTLEFLLRHHHRTGDRAALDMVVTTLRAMASGGIRDHLGGGFHRYSVDDEWLVPHFEKMLYDNGLLARVFLHAFQITDDPEFRDALTSTLDYVLEDLRDPSGGFYSARDADSEGEEGRFYVWSPEEVEAVLGREAGASFCTVYGVSAGGNFEGKSILHLERGETISGDTELLRGEEGSVPVKEAKRALTEARNLREHPLRDEKVLVSWNGFVLRALAEAGVVLGRDDYLEAARANAEFLLDSLRHGDRLHRSWKDGDSRIPAFLEDYAALGNALLTLYEVSLDPRWLNEGKALADQILALFWEEEEGVFYDSPHDGERLVVRPRDIMDNATPSGNSLAVELLLRISAIFGGEEHRAVALRVLAREMETMAQIPSAFGRLLSALALSQDPPLEVVLLGGVPSAEVDDLLEVAHRPFLPSRIVLGGEPGALPSLPALEGREIKDGGPTAYVCQNFTCSTSLQDPGSLAEELARGYIPSGAAGGSGGYDLD